MHTTRTSTAEFRAIVVTPGGRRRATIIALGQTLGLKTVAEGVELESQRKALRSLGCVLGQGYLFSKPREEDELVSWLDLDLARRFSPVTSMVAVAAA